MRYRIALFALTCWSAVSLAASTLQKTPAIDSPDVAAPLVLDFFFSHDFALAGSKVINSPTLAFELGVLPGLSVQVQYATNSDIGGEVNEAFPSLKLAALSTRRAQPLDLTLIAGYDTAAKSVDGQLVASRAFGPLQPYLAARVFSDGYGVGGATFAGAVGLQLRVLPKLSLVGDVGKVLAAKDLSSIQRDSLAWSGGIAFELPYTPHSVSFFATNVNTHTPEGASRGGLESWRFGFEFDVPIRNLARYTAIFSSGEEAPSSTAASGAPAASKRDQPPPPQTSGPGRIVRMTIKDLRFSPAELHVRRGTTVEWTNGDTVPHTVTATDRSWDSGTLAPGATWRHTFDAPGRFPYFCEIHPFMKATVIVEASGG